MELAVLRVVWPMVSPAAMTIGEVKTVTRGSLEVTVTLAPPAGAGSVRVRLAVVF